jgi:invasion protein IalB
MIFHRRRPRLAALCGAVAALSGAALLSPARAQQPTPPAAGENQPAPLELPPLPRQQAAPGEKFGDWVKRCEPKGDGQDQNCFISQVLVMSQNNQRRDVLAIAMGYYGVNKVPGVILRVPLNLVVYLPAGLVLTVPGAQPMRIVFDTCLPVGCNAAAKLEPETITAMQKAARGTVELVNIRRQKLALPISFKGFTAGFAAVGKS